MSVYIWVELQRQIRDLFSECCAYCRTAEFLTAMTFEFEHIIPLAVGGETVFENLCFACPLQSVVMSVIIRNQNTSQINRAEIW